MRLEYFTLFFDWLAAHPGLSGLIVFLIAFSESLALVGLIVPGALLMVGIGALIATGYLPFWSTTLIAVVGAIAGDSLSYWLGVKYNKNLANTWPFSRYPDLFERSQNFFNKHGSKSVFLGRFIGPLRPIIPAVAGMLHMPMHQFVLANITSAVLWAPLYLLPGILFGASLELASEFAGRFTLLLVVLLFGLWLFAWLMKQLYIWLTPGLDGLMARLVSWSRRHPVAGEIPAAIVTPDHPEVRGLSLLVLIMLLATLGFIAVSQLTSHLPLLPNLNQLVLHALNALHNPPFDQTMLALTSLGDIQLLFVIVLLTSLGLMLNRNWLALWHWLLVFILPVVILALLQYFHEPPTSSETGIPNVSHPLSGYALLTMAAYGFLAMLLAEHVNKNYRLAIYLSAVLLVLLIAFSRLYLGAQWLTEVITGLLLGLAWTALIGIAYRRHAKPATPHPLRRRLLMVSITIAMLSYPVLTYQQQTTRYFQKPEQFLMGQAAWLDSGWELLPSVRHDLRGRNDFPFTLQWHASADTINHVLQQAGWERPQHTLLSYSKVFNPAAEKNELPLLPHVHDGQYENIRWIKHTPDGKLFTLRLWHSNMVIQNAEQRLPLWYGNVSNLVKTDTMGLSYLITDKDFTTPLQVFSREISQCRQFKKVRTEGENAPQDKNVLLLDDCSI